MTASFDSVVGKLWEGLERKLTNDSVLPIFVEQRKKFEGWLKVEVCRLLQNYGCAVVPEKNYIDVTTEDMAIELKMIPTNYPWPGVPHPHRKAASEGINRVLKDIGELRFEKYSLKMVHFIAYPLSRSCTSKHYNLWVKNHLSRIQRQVAELVEKPFKFQNGFPGIAYFGHVE
jgi:hypothetical protein